MKVVELNNFPSELDLFAVLTIDRQSARTRLSLYEPGSTEWPIDESLVFMVPSKPTTAPTAVAAPNGVTAAKPGGLQHSASSGDISVKLSSSPTPVGTPGSLTSRVSVELSRDSARLSRENSGRPGSPNTSQLAYQPHLRIDVYSQEYPAPRLLGSAIIEAVTSYVEEHELVVDILADGRPCGSITILLSYSPVYTAQQEGMLKTLTSSRSTMPDLDEMVRLNSSPVRFLLLS